MREKPNPEITNLTHTLIKLQEVAGTAQSVDNSGKLVSSSLIAGLSRAALKKSTSSS